MTCHTLNIAKDKGQDSLIQKNLGSYKEFYPAVWYQQFQGGNVWVTTLGIPKKHYQTRYTESFAAGH
jgi:hypothetical protein